MLQSSIRSLYKFNLPIFVEGHTKDHWVCHVPWLTNSDPIENSGYWSVLMEQIYICRLFVSLNLFPCFYILLGL